MNRVDVMATVVQEVQLREVEQYSNQLQAAITGATEKVRHLLIPILHRWGMGLRGGTIYLGKAYKESESGKCHPHTHGNRSSPLVKDKDMGVILHAVYPKLWEVFNTKLQGMLYTTLSAYLADIPLPTEVQEYIYIEATQNLDSQPTLEVVDYELLPGKVPSDTATYRTYYGPITKHLYNDFIECNCGVGVLLSVLPECVVTADNTLSPLVSRQHPL